MQITVWDAPQVSCEYIKVILFFFSFPSVAMTTGSSCVTSFEGRTVNSFWWCQRRLRSIRHGGLMPLECLLQLFRLTPAVAQEGRLVQSGNLFPSSQDFHSTNHRSTLASPFFCLHAHCWTQANQTGAVKVMDTQGFANHIQEFTTLYLLMTIMFGVWNYSICMCIYIYIYIYIYKTMEYFSMLLLIFYGLI